MKTSLFIFLLLFSMTMSLASSSARELPAAIQQKIKMAIVSDDMAVLLGLLDRHNLAADAVILGEEGRLWSPLRFSVLNGKVSVVRQFIMMGKYLDEGIYPNDLSLRRVAEVLGYEEIAEIIQEAGIKSDKGTSGSETDRGDSTLDMYVSAARRGDMNTVKDYFENQQYKLAFPAFDSKGTDLVPMDILLAAVESGQKRVVEYLLSFSKKMLKEFSSAVFDGDDLEKATHAAQKAGYTSIADMLMRHR